MLARSMIGFKCIEDLSIVELMETMGEEGTDNFVRREIDYYAEYKIDASSLIKKLRDTANFVSFELENIYKQ